MCIIMISVDSHSKPFSARDASSHNVIIPLSSYGEVWAKFAQEIYHFKIIS